MKYYSRLKVYKASNVVYYPEDHSAFSYGWWKFVSIIKGKMVFNNYRYSVTTAKHQRQVKQLLNDLGLQIDLVVEVPRGLQNITTISGVKEHQSKWLAQKAQMDKEKRLERNRKARERRAQRRLEVQA